MKCTALAGLFISAAMLASPVFAATDLCDLNLQKIKDAKISAEQMSEDLRDNVDQAEKEAMDAKAAGKTEDCISISTQALQDIADNNKGGK